MKITINKQYFHIVCLQVVSGEDYNVRSKINNKYSGKVKNFSIWKGLGAFDLIVICEVNSLRSEMPRLEEITGVLKISYLNCFSYDDFTQEDFVENSKKYDFFALTLYKLEKSYDGSYENEKKKFLTSIKENKSSDLDTVFGTLGWYEISHLRFSNNINEVIKSVFDISNYENSDYINKTFTVISLNSDKLPAYEKLNKKNASNVIKTLPDFEISDEIKVAINITCKPKHSGRIYNFWEKVPGAELDDLFGLEDILVKFPTRKSWAYVLFYLLYFRKKHGDIIIHTKLSIRKKGEFGAYASSKETPKSRSLELTYNYDNIEKICGDALTVNLTTHIDYLKMLFENQLIGETFYDLAACIGKMARILSSEKNDQLKDNKLFLNIASEAIPIGIALRLYGTFGTIEGNDYNPPLYKAGYQRAIIAIQTLIHKILSKRVGSDWEGFVISVDRKFFARDEILNVPSELYLKPKEWWPIYHEIGHMVLDNCKIIKPVGAEDQPNVSYGITDERHPIIKRFLANKIDEDNWLSQLDEICAETIGFELGFYGDFNTYLDKTWNYIKSLEGYEKNFDLEDYILRTFCVEIYSKLKIIDRRVLDDIDELYVLYKTHVAKIEKLISRRIQGSIFFVAKSVKNVKELIPILFYFNTIFNEHFAFPKIEETKSKAAKSIMGKISKGEVFFDKIEQPEAILYQLMKKKSVEDKCSIAFILSLWHQRPEEEDNE